MTTMMKLWNSAGDTYGLYGEGIADDGQGIEFGRDYWDSAADAADLRGLQLKLGYSNDNRAKMNHWDAALIAEKKVYTKWVNLCIPTPFMRNPEWVENDQGYHSDTSYDVIVHAHFSPPMPSMFNLDDPIANRVFRKLNGLFMMQRLNPEKAYTIRERSDSPMYIDYVERYSDRNAAMDRSRGVLLDDNDQRPKFAIGDAVNIPSDRLMYGKYLHQPGQSVAPITDCYVTDVDLNDGEWYYEVEFISETEMQTETVTQECMTKGYQRPVSPENTKPAPELRSRKRTLDDRVLNEARFRTKFPRQAQAMVDAIPHPMDRSANAEVARIATKWLMPTAFALNN